MKIGILYTVKPVRETLPSMIEQALGPVEFIHVLDEALLEWMKIDKKVTRRQVQRMQAHIQYFEDNKIDLIISSCSSLGDLWQQVTHQVTLPILKIDEAMMKEACKRGTHLALIGTAPTTMTPSLNHLKEVAKEMNKIIHPISILHEEAGVALFNNKHQLFLDLLENALKRIPNQDVIILAQASMEGASSYLEEQLGIPVLCSPKLFIKQLEQYLGGVSYGD